MNITNRNGKPANRDAYFANRPGESANSMALLANRYGNPANRQFRKVDAADFHKK
ncbi:hypothetical protein [Cytobacillus firmus]|uniref:hypothetical protein n=1 Tax=Cytobacillus firmus TaxID=1399 RepID=UPI0021C8DD0C|nr:hypothetical protein [Cytobacillus firmus]